MSPAEPRQFLIVVLGPVLRLALVARQTISEVELDGRRFVVSDEDEVTGFYDWLRDSAGRVMGVRYAAFEDRQYVVELCRELPYVHIAVNGVMDIWLAEGADEIDEQASSDQAFGGNWILMGEQGEMAITFEMNWLDDQEIDALRAARAAWLDAR